MSMSPLPLEASRTTAESLLETYFLPLYPRSGAAKLTAEDLARLRRQDANPARNPAILAHLEDAAERFALLAPKLLRAPLELDFSDASVHRLSAELTSQLRGELLANGDPGTESNAFFNFVVHGASYLIVCIIKNHSSETSSATVGIRSPLWESLVFLRSKAGDAEISPFSWILNSFADEAFELHGLSLADRYRQYVENTTFDGSTLPVWLPTDRTIPRLKKVRYDLVHQQLKSHLPEVRDLGRDFPSPERFAEYGFTSMQVEVVGEGRLALLHGPSTGGYQLFWVGQQGFEKAAFVACDAFPEPKLTRAEDGKLLLLVSFEGKLARHEFFFWGP